ncbi:integral membrane sensor signal transduction histidine kinase [Parvibaculum lavamentivorans DS-1]|uniref:histidine kinase n=1 Tax=Parvibaculum lavamentivorans (strain DS-1 / DSM 13023 / NCIMB 13966) TaxID=402881 RepID=A7HVQ6_PARL1|nr:MASE4 domain-containing protein [Parvibaculum lavamentivorans]ABS63989.1 integral membrane sensor signal transduction histidine kinase [Parvibaculum lavamentivorans DS-1]
MAEIAHEKEQTFLITTARPTRRQVQLAVWMLASLVVALLITMPFARTPLENTEIFLPAYASAILVNELFTAALLVAIYAVQRSAAILVLAAGYLFTGLLVVPWAMSFPGVFNALGFDMGLQSTAMIAVMRRIGFPLCVIAYVLLKDEDAAGKLETGPVQMRIVGMVFGVTAFVGVATWLIVLGDDLLPGFMEDTRNVTPLWSYVPAVSVTLYVTGIVLLWRQRRSVLDLWLMVVLATLCIEIVLLSYVSGGIRLSIGWWAGRICGLISASMVLVVLLSETAMLYGRLARALAQERRIRDARLSEMEALSASIAHEVNQPVASMATNANAGLRWLEREYPEAHETKAALTRIVRDGHRAGDIIRGVRSMFNRDSQVRVPTSINDLIAEVVERHRAEMRQSHVALDLQFKADMPVVTVNRIQIEQAVANLVTNAIDAMRSISERERRLSIVTGLGDEFTVLVSVADRGAGVTPAHAGEIFKPFYTTKPDGMGMGLMFCRSAVESHGGNLWVEQNKPCGAVFRFTLPCSIEVAPQYLRDAG